jgi:hypothetical protein
MTHMIDMAKAIYTVPKLLALTPALSRAISDYRFEQRLPSENEAIRRLIEAGLKAESARRSDQKGNRQ